MVGEFQAGPHRAGLWVRAQALGPKSQQQSSPQESNLKGWSCLPEGLAALCMQKGGKASPEPFACGFPHLLSHDHLIYPELEHPVRSHITHGVCPAPAAEGLQRQNAVGFPVMDYPEGREI